MRYSVAKKDNGFHIGKTEDQLEKERIVNKATPSNKEIVYLLNQLIKKVEEWER